MNVAGLRERIKEKDAGVSSMGMRKIDTMLKSRQQYLKKHKIVMGSTIRSLFPLELQLPFNPFDLDDTRFSSREMWKSPFSVTTTVLLMKEKMRINDALHELVASKAGMKKEDYDISLPEDGIDKLTDADYRVFAPFRRLLHYSMLCARATFTTYGKYPKKFLSRAEWDKDGNLTTKDLAYKIFELENDIFKEKKSAIEEDYAEGGSKFGKPEEDMKNEIKAARESKKMSYPYLIGTARYTCYEIDKASKKPYVPETKVALTAEDIVTTMDDSQFYLGAQKDFLEELEGYMNESLADMEIDKNYSRPIDYLEVDINYPVKKEEGGMPAIAVSAKNKTVDWKPKFPIHTLSEGFLSKWIDLRDDEEKYSEKCMMDSVMEYKLVGNTELCEKYKKDLEGAKGLITEEMIKVHKELIGQVNSQLTGELVDQLIDGELKVGSASDNPKTLDSLLINAGDTNPGFGVEIVDGDQGLDLTKIEDANITA